MAIDRSQIPLRLLLRSPWDGLLVILAAAQAAALLLWPSGFLIAAGVWWGSNTISHNFIHRPFFTVRLLNLGFSLYLTALLGIPQSLWRSRHLAHHAAYAGSARKPPAPHTWLLAAEAALVVSIRGALLAAAPRFFLLAYLPGYLAGLALCALHGRYEHARGTVSHYGRLYNFLFLNDGYHVEHHLHPGLHFRDLPARRVKDARSSAWPPVLRWIEALSLDGLERLALR